MKLSVTFLNLTRPPEFRSLLCTEFRDAMLEYCPSVELLHRWQQNRHFEYFQARQRGVWATTKLLTEKERNRVIPIIKIDD